MTARIANLFTAIALAAALVAPGPALADGIKDKPLPRFEDPLCPGVMGMEVEAAETLLDRFRQNAARLDRQIATPGDCQPNIVIAFVEDGREYLRTLERNQRSLFDPLEKPEREALLNEPGPVRVWMNTIERTGDGHFIGKREGFEHIPTARMWSAHSRIYVPIRDDITWSMVLIDADAVGDADIGQLADFATLLTLAKDPGAQLAAADSTMLDLFDPGAEAPDSLSPSDLSYLETLYAGIPNLPASARIASIEKAIAQVNRR